MTAANDDVDEEALLYGDVGACATTTATNGENSTRALNRADRSSTRATRRREMMGDDANGSVGD